MVQKEKEQKNKKNQAARFHSAGEKSVNHTLYKKRDTKCLLELHCVGGNPNLNTIHLKQYICPIYPSLFVILMQI